MHFVALYHREKSALGDAYISFRAKLFPFYRESKLTNAPLTNAAESVMTLR